MEDLKWKIVRVAHSPVEIPIISTRLAEAEIPYMTTNQSVYIIWDDHFAPRILVPEQHFAEASEIIKSLDL